MFIVNNHAYKFLINMNSNVDICIRSINRTFYMETKVKALQGSKYTPIWMDNKIRPKTLPALKKDIECDLLIVGGGFTGLWAALQAKEKEPTLDVVLVESTFFGNGAS